MKLDLNTLENGETEFGFITKKMDFSPDPLTPVLLDPVKTTIKLFKKGSEVSISGKSIAELNIQCSRCLEMSKQLIKIQFTTDFRPKNSQNWSECNIELSSDELDVVWYTGNELDLDDQVRQNIILNLPMQPLCMQNCKGLCSQCGINLNKKSCQCHNQNDWNAFKELSKYRLS